MTRVVRLLLLVVTAGCATFAPGEPAGPKNIIVYIGDGAGAVRGERVLGLFAPAALGHEIDRHATGGPSLAELTETALRTLARDDGRRFVLLVESEAIDVAGDHETGGLSPTVTTSADGRVVIAGAGPLGMVSRITASLRRAAAALERAAGDASAATSTTPISAARCTSSSERATDRETA